ncbi:ABC transporter substrate-binding protein [Pontibacillus chungwhensis BH030062]|uniref:ABC transporter substrate-binding protein n=1 Tax=Pontibacillus chungwhensis BH030062 TaxID=1385513 RepID=A0A0A2UT08_9BACI|nr:TRAP transporter substrate-binding protein [Pontibacillus chungwhensis]KGP89646.1 ABC transporter substrate-binding protein [Pontibacillus chungwhensis BH030062]
MKRLFTVALTAMLILVLAACGGNESEGKSSNGDGSESGEEKVIRAGIGLNDKHPQYKGLLKFKEIVEEKTDGSIKVETFHSGQLGDDRTMIENLQINSQQVVIPSTAPMANFVPEFSVFDIPFLFPSEDVADQVLDGETGQKILDKLEGQDLKGLAYWENGFRDLTNSERAVSSVEDFKGLKIRTMENDLHLDAFKALGANPTPMAFTELFTAMQQGTVDGQENPYATIYLQKFYEVQDHVSNTHHIYSPFVFLMSKTFFDNLSEENQKIVKEAAEEAGEYERKLNREANEKYLKKLQEEGMEFTEITDEAREEMKKKVQPVVDEYKSKIGEDIVDEVYKAVEEASK